MKKYTKSIISLLLAVALVVSDLPLTALAQSESLRDVDFFRQDAIAEMSEVTYKKEDTLRSPKDYYIEEEPEGTLVALDEYAKTYQVSETQFITQIGGDANVYEDKDGNLNVVDNTLVEKNPWFSADYFENKANDYEVKLPMEITEKNGLKLSKDGHEIELIPQGGDFSKPVVAENAILYNDVFEGIDYQYTVLGDTIKEDIVLNKAVERYEFDFEIKAKDLQIKEDDGAIILFDTDEKNPVYTIIAPEMVDASGNVSTNIKLSLSTENHVYMAKITVDSAWLQSPDCAYPVRIDPTIDVSGNSVGLFCVEQGSPNTVIGDNNYPYVGYDDGVTSGNLAGYGSAHLICRTYASIGYNFSQISKEAKIDSATFSVYHYTAWSRGATNFGLYEVDQAWNPSTMSWNNQTGLSHTFIQFQRANATKGWINWNVRDVVNSWVQGTSANHGFVIKAENERNMQCEVFHNRTHANKPRLTINWSVPDPVDMNYPLNSINVALRPITEKDVNGKLIFDAVFADGTATPEASVRYWLSPDNVVGNAKASLSYKYPDSTAFHAQFPNGTKYKDKLSNWQTQLFGGFEYDKAYIISATATKNGSTSVQADSDKFLIYKIKQNDTFPYIANYYGVPLNTIMRDNRVQDTLVIENNTIFIRNPKTEVAYNPAPLTDDAKKAIDSALMGRGLHCEYGFEPINLNTGNFYFNATDATISDLGGDFNIERTYNSKADGANSLFGRNWSFAYDEALSICGDGRVRYSVGDGKVLYFTPNGDGTYTSPAGYYFTLKKIPYTVAKETYYRYEIHETDGSYKKFNAWGLLSEIVDKNGFTTSIQYNDNYQIKSITSPSGKVYGITCDDMGRISEVLLPNGATLRYTYDKNGDLTAFTDANGNTVRYEYDSKHRMTAWYDQEDNRVVLNEYDSEGRVTKQTDANGKVVKLEYKENQTITTDANGNVTKYTYDDQYRTTKIEYPNGKVENKKYDANNNLVADYNYTYTYDAVGNVLTETRRDGAVRSYVYDEHNQVIQVTEFDGTVTKMEYSPAGDLVKTIYADGTVESYEYDALHRVISHTNANGNTEYFTYDGAVATGYTDYKGNKYTYSYNAMNQLISTVAPDGSMTRKMYNAAGVQIGEEAADGGYTEYVLNKIGNVVRVIDAMGYASDFAYDGMYNIIKGTDPEGNVITYTYDGNGNTLTETDAKGNKVSYEYDSMNQLVKTVQADGTVTKYSYDIDGNLIQTVNPDKSKKAVEYNTVLGLPIKSTDELGNETTYEYTKAGQPEKITYADGTCLKYQYDTKGRLIKFTDETGLVSEFIYDANGNILKLVENGTREYSYTYDANNNLIKTIDPLGGIVEYEYDTLNRQTKVVNEVGAVTKYTYDPTGRITQTLDAANNAVKLAYDKNGNTISVTQANEGTTTYNYDALGNLISEKDALGNITNYSYDNIQQLDKITNALGGETDYAYDKVGNVTKVTDALGNTASIAYDSMGNATEITLENGDKTTFEYDKLGRVTTSTDAAGLKKEYTYDCMGRVLEVSDNTGSRITYKYDKCGRLLSQTDVIGRSEVYEYDEFSQVISVVGTDKNKTTFAYDKLGRLVSLTDAEDKTTNFQYDATGNLIKQTEADGKVYTYAYDLLNRVTKAVDPIGAETGYIYDSVGNLTSVTDGNGVKTSYAYDKLNRLISDTDGNGNTTTYEYDELSRLLVMTEPEGGRTEYRYDAVGNLTKAKDANGYITEFVFDEVGNVVKAISQRGAEVTYTYDKHNNLTSETDALGNVTSYEVDLNGMTTKMTQANGGEYAYAYDEVNRITEITTPNGYKREFTYDEFGNLTKESDNLERTTTYKYDIMHRVTEILDPEGNGTSYTYDKSGNLSTVLEANGATTSYVYNLLDQVTSQTDPEGNVTEVKYDLVGNITSVTEPGERTTKLTYDKNYNLVSVTDPMGYVSSQSYDKNNRVISTTNALGNSVAYEYDALGQATKVTDASGAVVRYQYDAHGNIVKVTNPLGGETRYTYDLADNLIKVTDPMERETSYTYDSMGNLTTQKDAEGKETVYTYDLEGNLTSLTDENGSTEKMTYDVAGNLMSIVRPDSTTVTYDYDKLNNLVSKTYSEDDSEVVYLYDTVGNRTSMTDTTGESIYTYDIMGRVTSVTSADGKKVAYAYDNAGNLSEITYADGRVVSYTYDLNDRLTKVSDDGEETTYEYDAIGRVTRTVRPDGSKTAYTYDERGNLVTLVNTGDDETLLSSFTYTYDEQGYIVKEVAESEDKKVTRRYSYNLSGELTLFTETEGLKYAEYVYSYDDSGNRICLKKNGVEKPETITYEYNKANQLISSTSTISGKTEYEYDENGSLISEQTDGEEEITYEYTVEQRLSAVREGGTLLMAASYDGDGNRVFQVSRKEAEQYVEKDNVSNSQDAKDSHESSKDSTQSPAENEKGLTETVQAEQAVTKTYYEKVYADPAETIFWYGFGQGIMHFVGNINSALSAYLSDWFCHAWDFITGQYELVLHSEGEYVNGYSKDDIEAMRRAGLTEEDIAEILGIEVAEDRSFVVEYTESRNTTQPTSDEKTSVSESVVIPENPDEKTRVDYELTYYVNDVNTENTQVLMEYGKRDELKSVYTYGNERISAETIADTYNPQTDDFETDYYLYDGRGSVTQVLKSSEIVESYTYDPFGNVTSGAPEFDSFYGYNAEDTNPVTGLQYLRARYYDTEDGRFSVADTYLGDVSEPLTLNRYSYTVNNPTNYIDPTGHFFKEIFGTVAGAGKALWDGVSGLVTGKGTSGFKSGWESGYKAGSSVGAKWDATASSALKALSNTLQYANDKIQKKIETTITNEVKKIRQNPSSYIKQKFEQIKQTVIQFNCGTADFIKAFKDDPGRTITDTAAFIVDNVGQFMKDDDVLDVIGYAVKEFDDEIDLGKQLTQDGNPVAKFVIDATIGAEDKDSDGVYHIRQNCIQSWAPFGYNDGYDEVFNVAIGATGNSMDKKKSEEFTVDGVTYMFWAWKGDYMNLGAGAETGIYKKYSDTHYLTATEKSTNMELTLTNDSTKEVLFNYTPYGDNDLWNNGKQWWVNGFDANNQNVQASELTSTTVIDFTKMENGIAMYEAFKSATLNSSREDRKTGWTFSDDYKATLRW